MAALVRLYDRRLIEALDPNAEQLSIMDKLATKDNGLAHLEMFTTSPVNMMALLTGPEEFLRCMTKIDNSRLTIPTHQLHSEIAKARRPFDGLKAPRPARRKAAV